MAESKGAAAATRPAGGDSRYQSLRDLGGRAHQLLAATRAADRFMAGHEAGDRNTASWLASCAVGLAQEVADDLDGLARAQKEEPGEPGLGNRLVALRRGAHELHAVCRAADRFLDDDTTEARETGGWLIACARRLADKLACEIDHGANALKRPGGDQNGAAEIIEVDGSMARVMR